jgi:hypothetical protein
MKRCLVLLVLVLSLSWAVAEDAAVIPRLANGRKISGSVVNAQEKGLAIKTSRGQKVYPWHALSMGTRYRYEPGFSDLFDALMQSRK